MAAITFSGAVDNVLVSFGKTDTVSANFEPAAASAVPEPASLVMALVGCVALQVSRSRRKAQL